MLGPGDTREAKTEGGALFLRDLGSPLPFSPLPGCRGPSHVQAVGKPRRALGQQHQSGSLAGVPGLALLKARAVNSALLKGKLSNKGKRKKREREVGSPGWESGGVGGQGWENRWGLFKQKA